MAGNSESYTKGIESMRANLAVDERQLAEMIRTGAKLDLFRRTRAMIERDIDRQKKRLAVAVTY